MENSITRLQCERTKHLLTFVVDESYTWPEHLKEKYRAGKALHSPNLPEVIQEIQLADSRLAEFKDWLRGSRVIAHFATPETLHRAVLHALAQLRNDPKNTHRSSRAPAIPRDTPTGSVHSPTRGEESEYATGRLPLFLARPHL
jgi:hypothetical protein